MTDPFESFKNTSLEAERSSEKFPKPGTSHLDVLAQPGYLGTSEKEKEKQKKDYSYDPYMSGASLPPNAFQEELSGKSLPEQVKFLKERGYTFRVISERLNVPMTNCYTAIKRFHLPKEYWDRIKTELRRKRRAREAAEESAVAKVLAKIPPFSKKQRLLDGYQTGSGGEGDEEISTPFTNTVLPARQDSPKTIQRKHLTYEDGKLVQYYRDQGLTLQKIAEKLQIPISSCYRILKRYQVSQKAGMIVEAKQNNDVHEPEFVASECSPTTKSTSELLLGMVDASMKSMPFPSSSKSPAAPELVPETARTGIDFLKTDEASSEIFDNDNIFSTRSDFKSTSENLLGWNGNGKSKCLMCGMDTETLNAVGYIQHMRLHQTQLAKIEFSTERLNSVNEDDDVAPTLQPQSTTSSSLPQSPSLPLQPEPFDLRNLPSTSTSATVDINHVLQAIREKLEWASKEIVTATDPDKILGLMKVMASGLQILGQHTAPSSK